MPKYTIAHTLRRNDHHPTVTVNDVCSWEFKDDLCIVVADDGRKRHFFDMRYAHVAITAEPEEKDA